MLIFTLHKWISKTKHNEEVLETSCILIYEKLEKSILNKHFPIYETPM